MPPLLIFFVPTMCVLLATAASPAVESFVNLTDKSGLDKGYHSVPPPLTRNFIPRKPDLTFVDEIVESENLDVTTVVTPSNNKTVENKGVSNIVKSNAVRMNNTSAPIIEDWNSDDKSKIDYTVRPNTEKIESVKTVRETNTAKQNKQYPRGNQRNWNNLMSQRLGINTVRPVNTANTKAVNTVRSVNTAASKPINSNINTNVSTARRKHTTARDRAVVRENKGKGANAGNPQQKEYKEKDGGLFLCDGKGRISGKQHKASCKAKFMNSISKPLHMLHMDLFGPTNVKSLMKKSYCLVVTDDFSRFSWVFFLATKDETSGILKTFITEIENQLDHKVKVIRSDNGTEFKNSVMNQFYEMKGIKREFSVARTPQQNGVAERKNRTLIEAARTMLVDSKLPTTFWAEAVNTACYVLNRVLVIKPNSKTPYELIRGRTPLIDFMKPFGCLVTMLNTRDHLGKFDGKTDEEYFCWVLCGNGPDWLFDVDSLSKSMNYVPVVAGNQTNGIAGTRDNIVTGQAEKKTEPEQEYILIPICTTNPLISQGPKDSEEDAGLLQQEKQTENPNSTNSINIVSTPVSTARPSCTDDDLSSPVNFAEASNAFMEYLFERFSPFKNAFTLPPVSNVTPMHDTGIFGNAYDDEDVSADAASYSVPDTSFTKFHKDHHEDQVIGSLKTHVQTRHMTKIHEEHGLFSSVHKLRRINHKDFQNYLFDCFLSQIEPKKPVQSLKDPSWVEAMQDELLQFKLLKKDERGIMVKNKARLAAQEHTQEEGIDYNEVFALVARIKAIRLFLAYASFKDFVVYQMDVKSAFLYGKIKEEVYVYQPPGFEDPQFPDKVYKVKKGSLWTTSGPKSMSDGIFISQDKYVAEILKKFDFASVKTASTPIETNKALIKDEEAEDVDVHLYRSMIGSLIYLTASIPDIIFVVCDCVRFQVTPKTSHLNAMKRIFRYLKGQPKLGLWYPRDSPFDLEAFSDSDYAGASLDRKSTTGGCQFLGKRLILWQCKKQTIVANLTTEAEYVTAANCCKRGRDTKIPQSGGPPTKVGDEAVYKELGDRMERAATTASSLEAEQDSGNIN
ncbi:putative ribonuclease H-like domain-containing protein [Tanacetum coccineum]